jgi:hypothetical protein
MLFGETGGTAGGFPMMGDRGVDIAGHFQQVGAYGMEAMVAGEALIERGEDRQAGFGAVDHGGGDGPVQGRHRIGGDAFQQGVDGQDLRPVGLGGAGGFIVQGGDGRL